jgi:hypothetical protein
MCNGDAPRGHGKSLQHEAFDIMEHTKELLSVLLSHRVSAPYDERRCTAGHIEGLAALVARCWLPAQPRRRPR